ncbi:MAG: peptidoglycan-binding protein [Anaerolineae bacterium]
MLQAFSASDISRGSKDFEQLNNAIVAASRLGPAWAKLADDWNTQVFEKRAELSVLAPVWRGKLNEYWEKYTSLWVANNGPGGIPDPMSIAPTGTPAALVASYQTKVEAVKAKPVPPVDLTEGQEALRRPVAELQAILRKLGYPATTAYSDGLYSQKTKAAWQTSAKSRGLNPQFDKASGTEAYVNATTFTALRNVKPVIPLGKSGMLSPVPGPEPGPVSAPATGGGVPVGTLLVGVAALGLGAWWFIQQKEPAYAV